MSRRPRPLVGPAGPLLMLVLAGCASKETFEVPPPPAPVGPLARVLEATLPEGPVTLAQAVEIAVQRNPDVASARIRLEGARAALDAASVPMRPIIGGDLSYLYGDAPSAYLFKKIDARELAPDTNFNDPGAFGNVEAGLALRWNLWNGGRDQLALWQAEAGLDMATSGAAAVRNALASAVVATYLNAVAARELLEADDASVRTVASQVDETRVKVEGGGALRSDLLSLEVRLAEARERRIRTDVARRLALATLRHLLALPRTFALRLAPVETGGEERSGLPPSLEEALAEAYANRPEVLAARTAVYRGRLALEQAGRGRLPRLDMQSRVYGDDDGFDFDEANWTVAMALTFDLYDAGRTRADVRRARAALDDLEEQDRKALLDVALEVESAFLRVEEARARLEVASQAVAAAEETLDLVEKQYRGGSATVTRYLETEGARTQARTARIQARLDLGRAITNAERALGRFGREERS